MEKMIEPSLTCMEEAAVPLTCMDEAVAPLTCMEDVFAPPTRSFSTGVLLPRLSWEQRAADWHRPLWGED